MVVVVSLDDVVLLDAVYVVLDGEVGVDCLVLGVEGEEGIDCLVFSLEEEEDEEGCVAVGSDNMATPLEDVSANRTGTGVERSVELVVRGIEIRLVTGMVVSDCLCDIVFSLALEKESGWVGVDAMGTVVLPSAMIAVLEDMREVALLLAVMTKELECIVADVMGILLPSTMLAVPESASENDDSSIFFEDSGSKVTLLGRTMPV